MGDFLSYFEEHPNINLMKLSNLNSNFALTLGYLNPALNNPAQLSSCILGAAAVSRLVNRLHGRGGGRELQKVLYGEGLACVQMSPLPQKIIPIYFKGRGDVCTQARGGFAPRSKALTFYVPHIQFWTEKVSLSYTLHWHIIPLLHTKFMTLHRFQINHSHDYTRKFSWLHE